METSKLNNQQLSAYKLGKAFAKLNMKKHGNLKNLWKNLHSQINMDKFLSDVIAESNTDEYIKERVIANDENRMYISLGYLDSNK